MGKHERPHWMRQRWDTIRTRIGKKNDTLLRKDPREEEVQRLRELDLPPYIRLPIQDIPNVALSSPVWETISEYLRKKEKLPYHLGQMFADATISFVTTTPDHIAAIIARVPETSTQDPSQRPLLDRYAFSPKQVLAIHDKASRAMEAGQLTEVDITFIADHPDSQQHLIWRDPIIVTMKTPQF